MKPNFALSLSFEGISLLHRAFPGWNRVGDVALDSPDLAGALAVLRETAQQINGHDITSKLVIPNDQIKYLSLDLGILGEEERDAAIRAALVGATPYPVDHLEFDWSVEGDRTHVAAVARETLAEAESFAESHGFGPLSFVAIPPEGQFAGEPFFGATRHAASVLDEGDQVQRDMAAIRITGVVRLPDPGDGEEEDQPLPEGEFDAPDATFAESTANAAPAVEDDLVDQAAEEDSAEDASYTAPEIDEPTAPEQDSEPEPESDTEADAEAADDAEAETETHPIPVFGHAPDIDQDESDDEEPEQVADPELEGEAEVTASVLSDTLPAEDEPEPVNPVDAWNDTPGESDAPAFASMRAHRDEGGLGAAPVLSGVRRSAEDLTAPTVAVPSAHDLDEPAAPSIEATPEAYGDAETLDDLPPAPAPLFTDDEDVEDLANFHADQDNLATDDADDDAPHDRSLSFLARKGTDTVAGLAAAEAAREDERQRMTVFGARASDKAKYEVGGKPRYLGLILSAVLLLFLAGVAAWASIFMDEGLSRFFGSQPTTDIVTLPADTLDELAVEGEEAMVPTPPEPEVEPVEMAALTTEPEPDEAPAPRPHRTYFATCTDRERGTGALCRHRGLATGAAGPAIARPVVA